MTAEKNAKGQPQVENSIAALQFVLMLKSPKNDILISLCVQLTGITKQQIPENFN